MIRSRDGIAVSLERGSADGVAAISLRFGFERAVARGSVGCLDVLLSLDF